MGEKIVGFGEIMLRLTPKEHGRITEATNYNACYGGSESNVMVALSSFGNDTEFVTVLPDNELGIAVLRHLHRYNVGTSNIINRGSVLGTYFVEEGFGLLPSKVIYNRSSSEIAASDENTFLNYDRIFRDCKLFHISGISFALSKGCQKLCFKLLNEAKKRGIPISFDFNYRGKLWSKEDASRVYKEILPYVDVLFCSDADFDDFLGIDVDDFYKYYNCKYLIRRNRQVISATEHKVSVNVSYKQEEQVIKLDSPVYSFPVLDRVGTGDAFCAGVLHGLLNDMSIKEAVDFGISCFVLKHGIRGDILTLNKKQIATLDELRLEDVKR